MRYPDIITGAVSAAEVPFHWREAALRLGVPGEDCREPEIKRCYTELERVLQYKYALVRLPLLPAEENVCDLGFLRISSRDLAKNLSGCKEVFLLAVTTGIGVDRLLERLSLTSPGRHFITDALSSAAAESLCDYVDETFSRGLSCKPRFSPGYGDVDLGCQAPLLERLDAGSTLGITLNNALLMTPVKSITAIKGILQ